MRIFVVSCVVAVGHGRDLPGVSPRAVTLRPVRARVVARLQRAILGDVRYPGLRYAPPRAVPLRPYRARLYRAPYAAGIGAPAWHYKNIAIYSGK